MAETMRTWRYGKLTGKLEDFLVRTEAAPCPEEKSLTENQIIVEVITAALNPVDFKLPESGWVGEVMIKRPATPGLDYCGRVVAKHPSNSSVAIGHLVFGGLPGGGQWGTVGQRTLTTMTECTILPKTIDPDHAAAVGTAATTAYQSVLFHVKEGDKVFINGGSGGVGTWAIQFAKVKGAEIVVSCSTANVALCKQLGADEVIDYKKADLFGRLKAYGQVFDVVIDNVGSTEVYDNRLLYLKAGGCFVQVGTPMTNSFMLNLALRQFWPTILNHGQRRFNFVRQNNASEYFQQIGQWMVDGRVRAVIDEKFDWENVPAALAKLRRGRTQGKIVIQVGEI
ncbi:hypothetical protein BKA67DRAFT_566268 [Truncatella angustata]|uniref:Enoyl reductase (ER) domain-containing protein n=1 Tax=Truncatella angustata TaxID=152316 RepID=A0A9P8ULL3_9PEZI|nr:uncharacterized protein BKA67DRAFT_566268 [Truncatella angustata]KAH6654805.1 hypothetical protein BKA67DRAFT_566268 [Truncatella angustata]